MYHSLFGQSAVAQRMADVWCYLGAASLIASWAGKLRLSAFSAILGGLIYLVITLVSSFRYHIGNGLQEATGMIFLVLAAWLIIFRQGNSYPKIISAAFLALIAYLVRQDHLGILAGLALMILDPARGGCAEVWKIYWDRFKSEWPRFFVYLGILFSGPLLVIFHNGWFAGRWHLIAETHSALYSGEKGWNAIYLLLAGNPWPQLPQLSGIFITFGALGAILALIWRPRFLQAFPMSLSISLLGLLVPYFVFAIEGYHPRHSIHLLPLAILSCMIIISPILSRFKIFKHSEPPAG
jgi:hypothetical protein